MELKAVMDEQYFLVKQGGFSWHDTEAMSVGERQYCCNKLVEEIKAQNKAMKDAEAQARAGRR